jgi:homoserine dehydrogenase
MIPQEKIDEARKISILKKYAKGEKVSDDDKKFAGIISEAKIDKTQPKVRGPQFMGLNLFPG